VIFFFTNYELIVVLVFLITWCILHIHCK